MSIGRLSMRKRISFHWLGITTRSRYSHWSSSKLATFLKSASGVDSPKALTFEGWDEYYDAYKAKAPITFFFVENVLPSLQNLVSLPGDIIHTFSVYYSNAIKNKVHYLKTGLEVGKWHDTDIRILCANMNALVDFVEIEWAWLYVICHEDELDLRADFYHYNRSPKAAEKYIQEELNKEYDPKNYGYFDPETDRGMEYDKECRKYFERDRQIVKDINDIYTWWKKYFKEVIQEYGESDEIAEENYLIKLIKVRKCLWT